MTAGARCLHHPELLWTRGGLGRGTRSAPALPRAHVAEISAEMTSPTAPLRAAAALALLGTCAPQAPALDQLPEALAMHPDEPAASSNYGAGLLASGEVATAMALFDIALTLDPSYARAYVNMGNAYSRLGHFDLAADNQRTAISLDSTLASFDEQTAAREVRCQPAARPRERRMGRPPV